MKFLTSAPRPDRLHQARSDYYRSAEGKAALARSGRFLELVFVADESETTELIETYR